jgi:uncharacterized protein (DUF58 family)
MLDEDKVRAVMKKVRAIEVSTRRAANDGVSGSWQSSFKGRGMNFEELRDYIPGDEVRTIDWGSTAKLSRPVVKVFREDRELILILVLDISASLECGSVGQSKREFASEIASVLALSAIRSNDKVGLFLFSDQIEKFIQPKKGQAQLTEIIREALFFKPQHTQTDLVECMKALQQMFKKKAIICVLSDFLQTKQSDIDELPKVLGRMRCRHDLICIRIADPREQQLANIGYVALADAETNETVYINTRSTRVREEYAAERSEYWDKFHDSCKGHGVGVLTLINGQSYIHQLRTFFQRRR